MYLQVWRKQLEVDVEFVAHCEFLNRSPRLISVIIAALWGAFSFVRRARGPVQPKRNVFLGGRARHTQTGPTSLDVLPNPMNTSANPASRDSVRRPSA